MRHGERAPRAGRGIIVTRVSLSVGSLVHATRTTKVVLPPFHFSPMCPPPSARDVSAGVERRADRIPLRCDLIKYGGIGRNW